MVNNEIKEKFRDRYKEIHPLIFQRSCEYALSPVDLFDILESIPPFPFVWDQVEHLWVTKEII